ncbi:glycosyltransferase family 2 protein [Methyloceanibacter sp.]|uniref:glycosyltransferase family 2 protein n=1 Tax=Methyloceanibacter sp. TaxID=1965321 RepID=UPI003D6D546A
MTSRASSKIGDVELSVVVAIYDEEEVLRPFLERLIPVLRKLTPSYEIICVNDGSEDRSLEILREMAGGNPHLRVIDFSRNFGKEAALSAGLAEARGDATVLIDADLQDPPELIERFFELWRQGYDAVCGVRTLRRFDTGGKRITARGFYRAFNLLSDIKLPVDGGDYRLLSRNVVNAINSLPERRRFMKGIFSWVGFKQVTVPYDRDARVAGKSAWSYWRLWNFALDGLTSFTTLPLRLWTYVGLSVFALSSLLTVFFLTLYLTGRVIIPGFYWIILLILFFGALQMVTMGIIGEYIGRIHEESKMRPLYLIREKIGFDRAEAVSTTREEPLPPK